MAIKLRNFSRELKRFTLKTEQSTLITVNKPETSIRKKGKLRKGDEYPNINKQSPRRFPRLFV